MKKIILLLVFFLCNSLVSQGQNLVENPGFETHLRPLARLQQATFLENTEFTQTVKGWKSQGYAAYSSLFSTLYKSQKWQEELGYNFRKCTPHSGHSMLRISACPVGGPCRRGSGGYVQTRLKTPAVPGKNYEAGFWIFVQSAQANVNCPGFLRHTGMSLSNSEIKLNNPECMLVNNSSLLLDTIKIDAWYHLVCRIAPVDTLHYLLIGTFYNQAASYQFSGDTEGCEFGYFIDDVELKEISGNLPARLYPDPVSAQIEEPEVDTQNRYFIYFDTNSDRLSSSAEATLDSVIAAAYSDAHAVFEINGHADNRGSGNDTLSRQRALRAKNYLEKKGKLSALRLEMHAYGSDSLAADNSTEAGRHLSRRVEIRKSEKDLPFMLYRHAWQTTNADSALLLLRAWLTFSGSDGMLLLHDPDLNKLHTHLLWTRLTEQVKESYKKFKNPTLAYQLDYLYFRDQRYRSLGGLYLEARGSVPHQIDSLSQDNSAIHVSDSLNAEEAIHLLDKNGWADPAVVGQRAASALFYPIQHAENLLEMKKALSTMKAACEKKIIPWRLYAMLFDRTQMIETGFQHFGTQYQADKNDPTLFRLAPLDDPAHIDEIREKLNMVPLDMASTYRILSKKK